MRQIDYNLKYRDINSVFNQIKNSRVVKMTNNICKAEFYLEVLELGTGLKHTLFFHDVRNCFIDINKDSTLQRKSIRFKDIVLEDTEFVMDDDYLKQYVHKFNVCIQLEDRNIYLNALHMMVGIEDDVSLI